MTMRVNGNGDVNNLLQLLKATGETKQAQKSKIVPIVTKGGTASKRVTNQNIENALNETSPFKAVKGLLSNSPVGLTDQPSREDLENMGYIRDNTLAQYHKGAPSFYKSADGGTITVYDGQGTAKMGEDKRKIVYQNGKYIQEMYYDENGKLTKGKIKIKDDIAGFTEKQFDFTVQDNKIKSMII